ncbi:MAG: fibronectin type III domain-containing protein [Janthinobacterium lividum]
MAVLLVAAVLGVSGWHCAQAQGSGGTDKNVKALSFMNSFGVNVHFGVNNYQNTQAIANALNIIGFSRIRSTCQNASDVSAWNDIASKTSGYFPAGLKANVLVTGYMNSPYSFSNQQPYMLQIANMMETIEGPNEIDNSGAGNGTHGPSDIPYGTPDGNGNFYPASDNQTLNYASNSAAWAQAIFAWKQSISSLSPVKLLAPTISIQDPADYASLPNISAYVDAGSIHFYAGNGRQPSNFGGGNFSTIYNWDQSASTPGENLAVTECGQTTASLPGQGGCDNATQAKYILNQMCDATAKGAYRTYLYQLMDGTDGDPTGNEGSEAHFGIFDYQWQVKPAAQALANVNTLLHDPTANFTPNVPAYQVTGVTNAGAAGSSLSISKSDGSTFIVVWNEPQIWDPAANAPVTPAADPVTVSFGGTYSYRVFDPLLGTNAIAAGSASSITVSLTGSPLMVQLIPASPGGVITGKEFDDGAGPGGGTQANGASSVYDGTISTFYDCANATGYAGLDGGTATPVYSITFAPRPGYESRMVGGVFEGSSTSATSGYTTLATVTTTPADGFVNKFLLSTSTAYRWLRYRDSQGGHCNVAEVQFVSPSAGGPIIPYGLTTTSGNGKASVSWAAASGATSYHVLRSLASGYGGSQAAAVNVTSTSFTDTGLTNSTTYWYQVTAVNASGHSGISGSASAQPVAPPAAPASLSATAGAVGSKTITVSWSASAGAAGYTIMRATSSGGTYTQAGTSPATTFSSTGLTTGTTYYYKVSAKNAGGTSALAGPVSATAP